MEPTFFIQPLIQDVLKEKDLMDFGSPPAPDGLSPIPPSNFASQPLNRLSGFISGTAAAAARRASSRGVSGSPSRSEVASPELPQPQSLESGRPPNIRCVAAYGNNVYVGSSDGQVLWFTLEGSSNSTGSSSPSSYVLRNRHCLIPRRAVDKLYLLPRIGKIAILADDGVLYFLAIPSLQPPAQIISPLKGVLFVALDDQEVGWRAGQDEGEAGGRGEEMSLCVVKRNTVMLYRIGSKLHLQRDIPIPETPKAAFRSGDTLCIADSEKYCIVDLVGNHLLELLPISQAGEEDTSDFVRPNIAIIPDVDEFLFTSHTGQGSLGVFVTKDGDPVRGTIDWTSPPLSLVIEQDNVIALLADNTIVIHSIAKVSTSEGDRNPQVILLSPGLQPTALSSNPYGALIPNERRDAMFALQGIRLLPEVETEPSSASDEDEVTPAGELELSDALPFAPTPSSFGQLTNQQTHESSQKEIGASSSSTTIISPRPSTTAVVEVLLFSDDSLHAVGTDSWIIVADRLLNDGKIEECARLAGDERRKAKRGTIEVDKAIHTADLRLIWARLAYAYFADAMFEESGSFFNRSKIDPRLVIRLFPELLGNSIRSDDMATVWASLASDANISYTLDRAINKRLNHIYGHDSPTDEANELRRQMTHIAHHMLLEYLRKARSSKRKSSQQDSIDDQRRDATIDTCLAKLLAERGEEHELLALLRSPNQCLLEELEAFIDKENHPDLLLDILRQLGHTDRVLEMLTSEVDKRKDQPYTAGAAREVFDIIQKSEEPSTIRRYGLWLLRQNTTMGLEIFTSDHTRAISHYDDRALIEDIKAISIEAANRYLEYVVVYRRSVDRNLHNALVEYLLDECDKFVHDDGVMYHFREIYEEYLLTRPHQPYCQYIAEMAYDSPPKEIRLKTILFLQGSPFYDLVTAETRLEKIELLFYERAIVLGRLGQHEKALNLLAVKLKDSVSAEMYCTQGGEVVPPKIARVLTDKIKSLKPWGVLGELGRRRESTVEGELRENLVMSLLKVYMDQGQSESRETAALLNAQALHLDDERILEMLPSDWSLDLVSGFVGRSFKRQSHERITWQILKSMAAGQNSQISEEYARVVGTLPPIYDDGPSGMTPPDEGSIPDQEHRTFSEKSLDEMPESEKPWRQDDGVLVIDSEKGKQGFTTR